MQILNIDALTTVKRQVTIDAVQHDVCEISVQQFIDNLAANEKLEADNAAGVPLGKSLELSIAAINESIPTLPEERIRKLPLEAMSTLMKFIRGDFDPQGDAATATAVEGAVQEAADAKKA